MSFFFLKCEPSYRYGNSVSYYEPDLIRLAASYRSAQMNSRSLVQVSVGRRLLQSRQGPSHRGSSGLPVNQKSSYYWPFSLLFLVLCCAQEECSAVAPTMNARASPGDSLRVTSDALSSTEAVRGRRWTSTEPPTLFIEH